MEFWGENLTFTCRTMPALVQWLSWNKPQLRSPAVMNFTSGSVFLFTSSQESPLLQTCVPQAVPGKGNDQNSHAAWDVEFSIDQCWQEIARSLEGFCEPGLCPNLGTHCLQNLYLLPFAYRQGPLQLMLIFLLLPGPQIYDSFYPISKQSLDSEVTAVTTCPKFN